VDADALPHGIPEHQIVVDGIGAGGWRWTVLLDGKTLKGWNVVGDANWTVADGAVQADKGTGFLVTPASYRDFQITLEFWVTDDANSGVFLRCSNPKLIDQTNAYEVNLDPPMRAVRVGQRLPASPQRKQIRSLGSLVSWPDRGSIRAARSRRNCERGTDTRVKPT